jgi:uncharacterized protein
LRLVQQEKSVTSAITSYRDKLNRGGPKKLLALDGGGIRGLIAIEVLAKIEKILKEKSGRNDFVLADYFDYIAGTSTGAVIGTLLSLGKSVDEIRTTYRDFAELIFDKNDATPVGFADIAANVAVRWVAKKLKWQVKPFARYRAEPLVEKLMKIIGGDEVTLCDKRLRTLLLIVMSNASTGAAWPVCNNPAAKYNDPNRANNNGEIPLWRLVRASTAAPAVFPAEEITDGKKTYVFVDGGVTPYNNPAFQLFLQATLPAYKLCWPAGRKKMLLVSVGTGLNPVEQHDLTPGDMGIVTIAETTIAAQFNSAMHQQDLLCRVFGNCLIGDQLDREVGEMLEAPAPGGEKLFTYLRYNAELTRKGLDALDLALKDVQPERINKLDSVEYMDDLQRVGESIAKKVKVEHFSDFLTECVTH